MLAVDSRNGDDDEGEDVTVSTDGEWSEVCYWAAALAIASCRSVCATVLWAAKSYIRGADRERYGVRPVCNAFAKARPGRCLDVVMDSGCGQPVAPVSLGEGREVRETPQSRRGHAFIGPADERYPNKGMIDLVGTNESGRRTSMPFNLAGGVTQALQSFAACNDADNIAVFDSTGSRHGSKVIPGSSEIGKQIRALVEKAEGTEMRRVKNTYYTRLWLDDPKEEEQVFTRRGS